MRISEFSVEVKFSLAFKGNYSSDDVDLQIGPIIEKALDQWVENRKDVFVDDVVTQVHSLVGVGK